MDLSGERQYFKSGLVPWLYQPSGSLPAGNWPSKAGLATNHQTRKDKVNIQFLSKLRVEENM